MRGHTQFFGIIPTIECITIIICEGGSGESSAAFKPTHQKFSADPKLDSFFD
jgi:hypothetical protein